MLERVWRKRNPSTLLVGLQIGGKQYGESLENSELPFDPTIPLLGIYPEKNITQKDTCSRVFIAALYNNSQDMETT